MNRTAFIKLLETFTKVDKQVLDRIGGSLRKKGMLSVGGRGLNAPDLTPVDAANIIIGLLSSDNASQAGQTVQDVSEWQTDGGKKLGEAIASIFSSPEIALKVSYISVFRNFPEATVAWSKMDPGNVYSDEPTPNKEIFTPKDAISESPGLIIEAALTGGTIKSIVTALNEIDKCQKVWGE